MWVHPLQEGKVAAGGKADKEVKLFQSQQGGNTLVPLGESSDGKESGKEQIKEQ